MSAATTELIARIRGDDTEYNAMLDRVAGRTAEAQRKAAAPTGAKNGPAAASASAMQDTWAQKSRDNYAEELRLIERSKQAKFKGQTVLNAALQQEIAVLREAEQMAHRLQISEQEAATFIRQRVRAEQEILQIRQAEAAVDNTIARQSMGNGGSGMPGGRQQSTGRQTRGFQVGLGGANMVQDMLQSNGNAMQSIGYGANNVLGLFQMGAKAGMAGLAIFSAIAAYKLLSDEYKKLTGNVLEASEKQEIENKVKEKSEALTRRVAYAKKHQAEVEREVADAVQAATTAQEKSLKFQEGIINYRAQEVDKDLAQKQALLEVQTQQDKLIIDGQANRTEAIRQTAKVEQDAIAKSIELRWEAIRQKQSEMELTDAPLRQQYAQAKANSEALMQQYQAAEAQAKKGGSKAPAYQEEADSLLKLAAEYQATYETIGKQLDANMARRKDLASQAEALTNEEIVSIQKRTNIALQAENQLTEIQRQESAKRKEIAEQEFVNKIKKLATEATKIAEQTPQRQAYQQELQIQQLRQTGHKRQADLLERQIRTEQETQRLKKMGFSAEEAAQLARQKVSQDNPGKPGGIHRLTPQEQADAAMARLSPTDRAKARAKGNGIGTTNFSALEANDAFQDDKNRNRPLSSIAKANKKRTTADRQPAPLPTTEAAQNSATNGIVPAINSMHETLKKTLTPQVANKR